MDFMSIEVAEHKYLFHSESFAEEGLTAKEEMQIAEIKRKTSLAKFPFAHNYLHDLESLWWVAVWIVFYNDFRTPQQLDKDEFLSDGKLQLLQARILFPSAMHKTSRRDGFQIDFPEIFVELPKSKHVICDALNILRQRLIKRYKLVETTLPHSIDTSAFEDEIYDTFKEFFVLLQKSKFALRFIPEIPGNLLGNMKRPRAESTNDTGAVHPKKK